MAVRLLFDRILVRPLDVAEQTTPAGLVIPDMAKDKTTKATVVRTGPGALLETPDGWKERPMQVKAGDTILYGKYTGQEIEVAGEKLLMMREEDVLAVLY